MEPIIRIENLGKRYRIRHNPSGQNRRTYVALRDVLAERAMKVFRQKSPPDGEISTLEDFWALRDVSFEVQAGEVLGIIGRNGAGKSTLLKILSRITEPTEGRVTLSGRVASLLEVGTGFHPELTGRENIYLNGSILGMGRTEIRSKFDEIVSFANVERFLDTPVKRFSSGMQTRLGFAVAAHLHPEILIVDEVLAVGDHEFQKRCLGKMHEVSKSGRTVLFVSHNMNTLGSLTTRCLQLRNGTIVRDGSTAEVVAGYLTEGGLGGPLYESPERGDLPKILRIEVCTSHPGGIHSLFAPLTVVIDLWIPHPVRSACLSFAIQDLTRLTCTTNPWLFDTEQAYARQSGVYTLTCHMPKCRLFIGHYSIDANLVEPPGGVKFDQIKAACNFQVECMGKQRTEYSYEIGEASYIEDCSWTVNQTTPSLAVGAS